MEKIFENVKLLADAVLDRSVKNEISPKRLSFYYEKLIHQYNSPPLLR